MALLAATSTGCELQKGLSEIASIVGDPDAQLIEGRGRQLAAGRFISPNPVGSTADGTFVLALEDNAKLAIIPFEGGEKCIAGPTPTSGSRYTGPVEPSTANAGSGKALVPYLGVDEDGAVELRFTDLKCRVASLRVPDGRLPLSSSFAKAGGFLVQTGSGALYRADPWNDELELVTESAKPLDSGRFIAAGDSEDWLWTLEGGEIIARDGALKVKARLGKGVKGASYSADGKGGPMLAYEAADSVYVAYVSDLKKPELLATDACGESFDTGANGRQLYYKSPCGEHRLRLKELDTDVERDLGTGVLRYRSVGSRPDGPILMYLTSITEDSGERSDVGTLWVRFGEETPIKLGNDANLVYSSVSSSARASIIKNWKAGRGGTLVEGKLGEKLTSIADDVIYRNRWLGALSDFNGVDGILLRPAGKEEYEALPERIVAWGMNADSKTERALVLTHWQNDTGTGTLSLVDADGLLELTDLVLPGAYAFTSQLDAITILRDPQEDGTNSLRLYDRMTDELVELADGVSEAWELNWPRTGMLYSVPYGDAAGVWFSAARQ